MPLVDVLCPEHGTQEVFAQNTSSLSCPSCSRPAKRVWNKPAVFRIDFRSGWDAGAGKFFDTKRDRENWISTSNSRRIKS